MAKKKVKTVKKVNGLELEFQYFVEELELDYFVEDDIGDVLRANGIKTSLVDERIEFDEDGLDLLDKVA